MEASTSEGRDELCLQPLEPYPGFSQLCNLCILVFRERRQQKSKAHVEFLSTLEESAKRGCRLCNLIFECCREDVAAKAITRLSLRYMVDYPPDIILFESLSMQRNYYIAYEQVEASHINQTSKQDTASNASSKSNKDISEWWFQRCRNDHPDCNPAAYSGRNFPRRLLEVGISSNGPTVKVIETHNLQDKEYMTLSHCWGGSLPIRLLTESLETFKTSIPFSNLPKTFQDAFSVIRWFGIKYLWIDALCIIQDSHDDWVHESGRMRDYYKYSLGTIAATGASNPSEGLFFDSNQAFVSPFRAIISWDGEEKAVAVSAGGSCLETLRREPLSQRGWFLQEYFLSPRILHFGRNHISWECRTELSCERWPDMVPDSVFYCSALSNKGGYSSLSHDLRITSLPRLWGKIVSTYSRMALTRLSDRCVAFAGIAEEIQAVAQDDYVAGLWRRDLPEALLWTVDVHYEEHRYLTEPPARSQSYLAPSWSWLAINRAVTLPVISESKRRNMVVINAEVQSVTENKFGAIRHGVISSCGALIPAICMAHNARWYFYSIRSKIIGESQFGYSIRIDEGHMDEVDKPLYCLPIIDDWHDLHGLLVVPTLQMAAQYSRVGTFSIRKSKGYNLLEALGAVTDDLNETEFENFTLV